MRFAPVAAPTAPMRSASGPRHLARVRHDDSRLRWSPLLILGIAVVGTAMIFLRRPDAFIHPQFWAEDGTDWFGQAYSYGGLHVLFAQHQGYIVLLNRLVALVAVHLPLAWAPSLFALAALGCQLLPAMIFVSSRSDRIISSWWLRVVVALIYFALPATSEVNMNLTNAQWHLAAAAGLVLVARPARTRVGFAFDVVVVALSSLTGPFGFMLLPIAAILAYLRRGPRELTLLGITVLASVAQVVTMVRTPRPVSHLGASVGRLARIVGGRVLLGPVLGARGYNSALHHASHGYEWVAVCVVGGACILAILWRATAELRLVVLFGALCLGASLIRPLPTPGMPAWASLVTPVSGARYFVVPMVAVIILVGAAAERRSILMRLGAVLFAVAALAIGIPKDWSYPPYVNMHYQRYIAAFNRLPKGQRMVIPENPGWKIILTKH